MCPLLILSALLIWGEEMIPLIFSEEKNTRPFDNDSPRLDVYGQMALDEAILLDSSPQSLVIRFYHWEGPAATFGCHQSLSFALRELRSNNLENLPLARRLTGGGLVFHENDLTFSLVFPWDQISPPTRIYKDIHAAVLSGLKEIGFSSSLYSGPPKPRDMEKTCFSSPEPLDLTNEAGDKILGGALRRKNARGLYQGSLQINQAPFPLLKIKEAVKNGLNQLYPQAPRPIITNAWLQKSQILREKYISTDWNERIN